MKLKEILWKLRSERNLTISQLSAQCKISENRLSAFEDGSMVPDIEDTAKLEEFYKVTASYLVGNTGLDIKPLPAIFHKVQTEDFTMQMACFDDLCMRLSGSEHELLLLYLNNCINHYLYTEDGQCKANFDERSGLFTDCLKQHNENYLKKQDCSYYVQIDGNMSRFFSDTCAFLDRMTENDYL